MKNASKMARSGAMRMRRGAEKKPRRSGALTRPLLLGALALVSAKVLYDEIPQLRRYLKMEAM